MIQLIFSSAGKVTNYLSAQFSKKIANRNEAINLKIFFNSDAKLRFHDNSLHLAFFGEFQVD